MVPRLEQQLQSAMSKRDFVRCQAISDASDVGIYGLEVILRFFVLIGYVLQALKNLAASNTPVTSPDFIKVKNEIEQNRLAG